MNSNESSNSKFILYSEYLFILVPFIVITIVKAFNSSIQELLYVPDWSFAASILWGQTIVKVVAGGVSNKVIWQRTVLVVSGLIVIGLIPSLITLALMLVSGEPPLFLTYLQGILFVLATVVFLSFGAAGQILLDKSNSV